MTQAEDYTRLYSFLSKQRGELRCVLAAGRRGKVAFESLAFDDTDDKEEDCDIALDGETWVTVVEANLKADRLATLAKNQQTEAKLLKIQMDSLCTQWERTKIVVLDVCFYISVLDNFGVINGCRVGRRPTCPVSAEEINCGLGYIALVLSAVRRRVKAAVPEAKTYYQHVLILRGAESAILLDNQEETEYPLTIVDGLVVSFFHGPKVDQSLRGLLEYYRDTVAIIRKHLYPSLGQEPFLINSETGSIKGLPIRYNAADPTKWAEAMKLFLIDMKWLIGISLSLASHPDGGQQTTCRPSEPAPSSGL